MDGFLNISHNFAGESQFIICEWVKSTAQGTPVIGHVTGSGLGAQNDTDQTEVFYPTPHINEQLQVINLPEDWFVIRFWRSADGISKDALLLEMAGNARTGATYPISRYEYVVGRGYDNTSPVVTVGVWSDPVQDDAGLRDTRLFEKTFWVQERGTGDLLAAEIAVRDDEGGGFDFSDAAKVMNDGAVYIVYVLERIESNGGDSSAAVTTNDDIYILDTDQDYSPLTMNGKTLIADFAGEVGTLTMPNLAILADSRFKLQTHGGNQRNVVIQLDTGDTVKFMGEDVNLIILGKSEDIEILIKDSAMYVLQRFTGHDKLGQMAWSYKQLINTLIANGESLALANYPRVDDMLDNLPVSSVVNETTWQTSQVVDGQTTYPNKSKWMREGANFRPPDLRSQTIKALAATDGSIAAGRYEHQAMLEHYHLLASDTDGPGLYLSNAHSYGGNPTYQLNEGSTAPARYRSGAVAGATGTTAQRNNNIGLYPLIFI